MAAPQHYTLKTDPREARLLAPYRVGQLVHCDVWKLGSERVRLVPGRVIDTPDALTAVVELVVPEGFELRVQA